ncbi:MAG TPA: AAA family ATPase, partial [Deltaproteobacteria bacterium]|nr:AAA family ATPase [Deltaproteobacteria bacterium]
IIGGVETFRDLSALKELQDEVREKYTFGDIVTRNPRMLEILKVLPEVAVSDATVLIQGESGTGKELFARAIHDLSPRKDGPLVKVNCAAVPETLLESELFGYVKGAFTDAKRDKPGRFKLAEGGTIFLDEIGDMPLALQAKLLRVLESKEYEPLGATKTERADVRVVAATNRDLERMVKEGQFREDLYYRLNVFKIALPPLRERSEDIPLLVEHFIAKLNRKTGKDIQGLNEEAMRLLLDHPWPGNVRELENVLEHAFILCKDRWIRPEHLPEYLRKGDTVISGGSLRQMERELIERTLKSCQGNISHAARQLGIHRTTLWRKLKKYNLL